MNSRPNRRQSIVAFASALAQWPAAAWAQQPAPMRFLCGYPPGGAPDVIARKVAQKVGQRTGAVAIVESKPGAAGRLAVAELKKAAPDGNHLLVAPASVLTMYPHVYRQLGYDVFTDLQPVCTVAATAFALAIGPKVPASVTDFAAFAQWCRANRASAQCANAGAGSMPHFIAILAGREAGIELDHVPYRGGVPALQAVGAGDIAAAIATEGAARPLREAGRLRILATTAYERGATFPGVPTFRELGFPKLALREWFGVFVPGRTPRGTVATLAELLRSVLDDDDVRRAWSNAGLAMDSQGPERLQLTIRQEHDFWGPLIRSTGFTPES